MAWGVACVVSCHVRQVEFDPTSSDDADDSTVRVVAMMHCDEEHGLPSAQVM